jgi:hypothetical protein
MRQRPDAITLRLARPEDLEALRRLVDRDGGGAGTRHMLLDLTRPGTPARVILATVEDDRPVAALHVDSRHAVADPFVETEAALQLLRARAGQLRRSRRAERPGRIASLLAELRPRPG